MGAKLSMGQLEAQVMGVLWDHGGWMTPGEVHAVLERERALAYTTVMTVLVRLCRKGRVERERDGRAFAYHPVQTREQYAAERMRELLAGAGDRAEALVHFVGSIDGTERDQLRRLLRLKLEA